MTSSVRMHAEEIEVREEIVRALLRRQFPAWGELPLQRLHTGGTDNAIFRLGDKMALRFPRIYWAVHQPRLEFILLPWLAPQLSQPAAMPLALGAPDLDYPHEWLIYAWLPGVDLFAQPPEDRMLLARDLAEYIAALRAVDFAQAPPTLLPLLQHGRSLPEMHERVQVALDEVAGLTDATRARKAWEHARVIAPWRGALCFTHGDLQGPNLLVRERRLSAVIDFGSARFADPASELIGAWTMFDAEARACFHTELAARDLVDDNMWQRARGYALAKALFALPYYQQTNPTLIAIANHTLQQVFDET